LLCMALDLKRPRGSSRVDDVPSGVAIMRGLSSWQVFILEYQIVRPACRR